jgi:hypothetical protein
VFSLINLVLPIWAESGNYLLRMSLILLTFSLLNSSGLTTSRALFRFSMKVVNSGRVFVGFLRF